MEVWDDYKELSRIWFVEALLYLVGGFNHLEKYESQWEGLSHILWKIKMFETTNQVQNEPPRILLSTLHGILD